MEKETGELTSNPDLSGDKLYQQRAREALPILIRQSLVSQKIFYSDLALEMNMPNPRNLNFVLGEIGNSLLNLSKIWNENIPPIQCIVINKNTELPGNGINWFIKDRIKFDSSTPSERKQLISEMLFEVFHYDKWFEVLDYFNLKPNNSTAKIFNQNKDKTKSYDNSSGESEDHKRMKEYISKNPSILNLKDYEQGKIEHTFPSSDTIDVLFNNKHSVVGVEVKSKISDDADIIRGMFQCVKYESLIEAENRVNGIRKKVKTILAIENEFPIELIPIKNILSIDVIDNLKQKIKNGI